MQIILEGSQMSSGRQVWGVYAALLLEGGWLAGSRWNSGTLACHWGGKWRPASEWPLEEVEPALRLCILIVMIIHAARASVILSAHCALPAGDGNDGPRRCAVRRLHSEYVFVLLPPLLRDVLHRSSQHAQLRLALGRAIAKAQLTAHRAQATGHSALGSGWAGRTAARWRRRCRWDGCSTMNDEVMKEPLLKKPATAQDVCRKKDEPIRRYT